MYAPSHPSRGERSRTVTPPHQTQTFTSQVQPIMASGLAMEAMPIGPSLSFMGPSTHISSDVARIRGLKLEIPEKYLGNQTPLFTGGSTKWNGTSRK